MFYHLGIGGLPPLLIKSPLAVLVAIGVSTARVAQKLRVWSRGIVTTIVIRKIVTAPPINWIVFPVLILLPIMFARNTIESMTSTERTVADAAINAGRAAIYDTIHETVSRATGIEQEEVKDVIGRLVAEHIIWQRGGPANNIGETGVVGPPAEGWYERGGAWPKG